MPKQKTEAEGKTPRWLIPLVAVVLLVVVGTITASVLLGRSSAPQTVAITPSAPERTETPTPTPVVPTAPTPTTTAGPVAPPVGIEVGNTAPDFTLKDVAGHSVSLSDFRGKVVILDFWASWCPPCRASMPNLKALYEKYHSQGVVMIGVSLDRSRADAENYLKQNGYHDLIALWGSVSASQEVARRYGVYSIPHTFILDRDGVIHFSDHPLRLTDSVITSLL